MDQVLDRRSVSGVGLRSPAAPELAEEFTWIGTPAELVSNLETLLARETSKVSDALFLSLQEFITLEVSNWFGENPKALTRSVLKKLTNSVATSGASGYERTLEAFSVITSWADSMTLKSAKAASLSIRDSATDFRKAKSYLAHQAKCVNAFLKYWQQEVKEDLAKENPILTKSVKSREDFRNWARSLSEAWVKAGGVNSSKNNAMYQACWNRFIEAVDSGRDDNYSLELIQAINRNYLEEHHQEFFIKHLSNISLVNRNTTAFKTPAQSSMEIEGGIISINSILNLDKKAMNAVKENLAFLCSQESILQQRKLEISVVEMDGTFQLVVSFNAPKELTVFRRTVDLVNKLLKEAQKDLL